MEIPTRYYKKDDYVDTKTGNKICRHATLCGTQNIKMQKMCLIVGKSCLRGDLAAIKTGAYVMIDDGAIVKPSYKKMMTTPAFAPIYIGDFVYIGQNAVFAGSQIGSHVYIGNNASVGHGVVIMDCARIEDGAHVAHNTTVPPFARMAGNPAKIVGYMPYSTQILQSNACIQFYESFRPDTDEAQMPAWAI